MRHLSEVCHAAGFWRRVVGTGCAAVADVVEIVLSAIDWFWAKLHEPLRFLRRRPGFSKFDTAALDRRKIADIAGHHGRPACRTRPVIDGLNLASRPDALKDLFSQLDADGDGQISKTEFESALGAGGTNLAQADDVFGKLDKWRRHGQPRRNVVGAEGQGSPPSRILQCHRTDDCTRGAGVLGTRIALGQRLEHFLLGQILIAHPGRVVLDARRCRAPHHEGLGRPHPESMAENAPEHFQTLLII